MQHFNRLSPAELERLAYLAEEMGEAIQIIGKILRHGYESHDPTDPTVTTNRELLEKEMGDVIRGLDMLTAAKDLRSEAITRHVLKGPPYGYMHHQGASDAG